MGVLTVELTWQKRCESISVTLGETFSTAELKDKISSHTGVSSEDFYLTSNGRLLCGDSNISNGCTVRAVPKLLGGKGGFGSMLRAIGAQIEKTTNREACRDLSGRRLRDINEEKRLKTWISQQHDRELQEAEKKQRKIEKLRAQPKHEFSDKKYEEERTLLIDNVHDAVEHGFQSLVPSTSAGPSSSSEPSTSKAACGKPVKKKPKKKGFMFEDEELSLSESEMEMNILEIEPRISTSEISSKKRSADDDCDSASPKKQKCCTVSTEEKVDSTESKKDVSV